MAHVTVAIKLDDLGYDTTGDNRGAANQFYDSLGVLLGKNVDRTETGDGYLYGSVHDLSEEAAAAVENMVALISLFSESPPILTECQAPSISVSPPDRQSSPTARTGSMRSNTTTTASVLNGPASECG